MSGPFASGTLSGAPTYYLHLNGNYLDLQHKATIGTITATPSFASIITGGSTPVSFTVQNSAPSLSDSLAFTATASTNMSGSASGSGVTPGSTSGTISGLTFSGTAVGSAQSGTFSLSGGTDCSNGPLNTTVSVNVYNHAAYRANPVGQRQYVQWRDPPNGQHPPGRRRAAAEHNSLTVYDGAGSDYRVALMGSGAQTGGSTTGLTLGAIGGSGTIPAGSSGTITASLAGPASAGADQPAVYLHLRRRLDCWPVT